MYGLIPAVAFTVGSFTVRWYGIIIACAMALGIYLAYRETQRQHESTDHLLSMLLLVIPCAVIGARLYYVVFNWETYAGSFIDIISVWHGGLAIHGGVIGGCLAALIFCAVKKENFLKWADIVAPSLVLGQAIGRWGNFANHEAFGPVIEDGSFWSWVPLQVYADGAYHHPTFLYESVWDLLIFIILMLLIRKPHRYGQIFSLYLILYAVGRFFIEALRTDSLMLGGLKMAQVVALIGIVLGIAILIFTRRRPKLDVAQPRSLGKSARARAERK